ncbi:DUF5719 family protein [Glaciihabitans sp. UYNi722]|uniref:DUF5719 family protein n=1 Tax=Glaciihabitans sp. UYNi722 TaxID=3156344 RepID=UPI00339AEFB9
MTDPTSEREELSEPEEQSEREEQSEPEEQPVSDEKPAKNRTRGAIIISARIVSGAIGVVVAAVAIAGAAWLPLPSHTATPAATRVTPVPAAQQRVCAGPMLRLGNDSGQEATTASSVGRPTVRYGQTAGDSRSSELARTDNTSGVGPQLLTLPPASQQSTTQPLLAGSQSQSVSSGDLVGFAAAECSEGTSDGWLVGGATDTGRTTLLTLSNPSNVGATVSLSLYGESGVIPAAGSQGIIVAPGGQRVFSLAGFAPGIASPVVRVQSRGGQVIANLQQTTVRTLEPGGVGIVGIANKPSLTNVIPGLVVAGSAALSARQAEPGYEDLRTVIRLLVPGTKQARAQISVIPDSGTEDGTSVSVVVEAGMVTDVPLDSFPEGNYSVLISSDQPVVAGARVSTVGATGATDFAWLAAAAPLHKHALVTVAPGPSPVLHLNNPTRTSTTVTLKTSGSAAITVTVPAGKSVTQPVTSSTTYTATGFDTLGLAVTYLGDGQFAAFSASPSAPASGPITIYR